MRRLIQSIGLTALLAAAGCGYDPRLCIDTKIGNEKSPGGIRYTDISTRFVTRYTDVGFDGSLDKVEYKDSDGTFVVLNTNSPYYLEYEQKFIRLRERATIGR